MSPILVNLKDVQFDPKNQRQVEKLEHGTFVFTCGFECRGDEEALELWRIANAEFVDSLGRYWTLLDEFEIKRSIASLGGRASLNFELDGLEECAHALVEGGTLRITLSFGNEKEIQTYTISHKGPLGPLDWKLDRRSSNG